MRILKSGFLVVALLAVSILSAGILGLAVCTRQTRAVTNAGKIIDDSIFTNANTMSVDNIQRF